MTTLDGLLDRIADPSQPLLTFYDLATGERVELSGRTTANWVAKTSNFLVDELDAEPGTRIRIGLPSHWLTMVWILSAWNVAATVADAAADIGVTGPDLVADEPRRVATALRPLAGRFPVEPAGFLDMAAEVPGQPDHFVAMDRPSPATPATELSGVSRSHRELFDAAASDPVRRLVEPGTIARDVGLIVDACLSGGSIVTVTGATPADIAHIAAQEGATID